MGEDPFLGLMLISRNFKIEKSVMSLCLSFLSITSEPNKIFNSLYGNVNVDPMSTKFLIVKQA